jgi:HPt (histidine-containing phosphotransfer) domain-containing protein
MSSELVFDPEAIQTLREISPDDPAFLQEIIGLFLEDTPKRLDELDSSLALRDAATLTRAAHSIKGSSGNFGAQKLRTLSAKIEELAKGGKLAEIPPLLPGYREAFVELKTALEAELAKQ